RSLAANRALNCTQEFIAVRLGWCQGWCHGRMRCVESTSTILCPLGRGQRAAVSSFDSFQGRGACGHYRRGKHHETNGSDHQEIEPIKECVRISPQTENPSNTQQSTYQQCSGDHHYPCLEYCRREEAS